MKYKINKPLKQQSLAWLLTAACVTSTLQPRKSQADQPIPKSPPSCDQVLSACDQAVNDAEKEIDIKKLLILDLTNQNITLNQEKAELEDSANAFYHNPWVMISLGLVVGVIGGVYAAKK